MDEGRLHAYLDGELDAAGRADLEAHLTACRACRGVLDEARALREESRFLLRGAGPTLIEEPPFGLVQARADRERGRQRGARHRALRATVWAASLIAALGLGWFGRTLLSSPERASAVAAKEPVTDSAPAAEPPADAGERAASARPTPDETAVASTTGGRDDAPSREEAGVTTPSAGARAEPGSAASGHVALGEVVAAPAPMEAARTAEDASIGNAPAPARAATAEPSSRLARAMRPDSVAPVLDAVNVSADAVEGVDAAAVAWRAIDGDEAKKLLGHDAFTVPDLEVLGLETTATVGADEQSGGVVRVRQRLEDGGEIELYQRRESASRAAAPRRGDGGEPTGTLTPPPAQPTPRPPTAPTPTPSGKPEPAKPTAGNGGLGSILDLFRKDSKKETGKGVTDIPWLVRFTPEGDATMLAGSVRVTAHGPLPRDRLRALLERVK